MFVAFYRAFYGTIKLYGAFYGTLKLNLPKYCRLVVVGSTAA